VLKQAHTKAERNGKINTQVAKAGLTVNVDFFVFAATLIIFVGGICHTQILDAGNAFLFAVVVELQNSF